MLSGPAGGAIAALSLGIDRVLALDMGGTSTDVSLLTGSIPKTRGTVVDGLPVPLPTVDIHTIGAGGGSIVKFDRGGMLALGPESAGADPGPASYGKGGPATLTDTALLAGRVAPGRFLGGKMPLDPSASSRALESIRPPQLKFDDMLDGIMELARVHLTGALRRISVARGIDPSAPQSLFTLVPFGGAGALFAVECARKMGLKEVFHPRAAGAFSALGLVAAPIAAERERVILRPIGSSLEQLLITQTDLTSELNRELSKWGETGEPLFRATVECRYVGQTHTLDIPLPDPLSADTLRKAFEAAYKARYTYLHSGVDIEIVALRVRGEIPPPEVDFPELDNIGRDITIAKTGATRIRSDGRWVDAPIYYRDRLPIETEIIGPALIIEDFATLYLPSGSSMHLNDKGHARIEVG
jgi:N-methylhydantoinase A